MDKEYKNLNQNIISNTFISIFNFDKLHIIAEILCRLDIDEIKFVMIRSMGYSKEYHKSLCPSLGQFKNNK